MKAKDIKTYINENAGRMMIEEESFFEGHNFITYGKHIDIITSDIQNGEIDKESVAVKWVLKLDIGNMGVFGAEIDVKSITAEMGGDDTVQAGPVNLNGFEHNVVKKKNAEVPELQIFLSAIHIDTAAKKIDFEFTI